MATVEVLQPVPAGAHLWQGYQKRPWLNLYGLRLRPKGAPEAGPQAQLALIQQLLPEELLQNVLAYLSPYEMGRAALVCRQWNAATRVDNLYQAGCALAFQAAMSHEELLKLARLQYRHRWRTLFLERPHLRFDGIYVSRNTYIRTGITEWRVRNPVHLVCYYRYLRFFPNGTLLYRTTPDILVNVAPSLREPGRHTKLGQQVQGGRYMLKGSTLHTAMAYADQAGTEVRGRHTLRSTVPGANNRLDVRDIISYDRGTQTAVSMLPVDADDDDLSGGRRHTRGKSPFVFVSWEHVQDSALNLPVEKMDFYLPG